ncbi:hypothetical protein [Alkaliphilus serpentinus]|uniref:Uncharacterized protein n=1 Tax=Alkaliphilus serpentinus TaxID=1482731 RepID=A0A833HP36_9FIRM|nr:hypothetical protein [Alkaliphilus serpentinus]KAB3530260.1 hypothetical protein F8153_07525 [Alkaliphilus serpentinus]
MDYIDTGGFLLWEWLKTLIIFSVIDILFIKKKFRDVIKSPDTFISSLIVASFLLIIRGQQHFSIGLFVLWTIASIILYLILKILYNMFMR